MLSDRDVPLKMKPSAILVIIDAFRPDAFSERLCPNLAWLRSRGSWTFRAQSVWPSITLPCHMSIFHSVPPERHGITTNDWSPMAVPLPGIVDHAHAAGLVCAMFYNWEPLRNLSQPNSLAYSCFRNSCRQPQGDRLIVQDAVRYLETDHPDFAFVYLGVLDWIGHRHGWMSDEYLTALGDADDALGLLLSYLPDNCTLLVHSDHGGLGLHHDTATPENMIIPWIIDGPHIKENFEFAAAVTLLDTAPTLAHILGIPPHPEWEGRCVTEVFKTR